LNDGGPAISLIIAPAPGTRSLIVSFRGIIPAVVTPFTAADEVDTAALSANISHLVQHGADGFVATGTMGEAGSLSAGERRRVIETVVSAADGRPVLSGASAGSTSAACANAMLAREAGSSGVMCLPPLHYGGTTREIAAFFAAVADAAQLPMMLYNNPAASGLDLTPDVIRDIAAAVPEIVCVKECSGDARRIAALLELTDLEVLVGGDDWALEGYAAGAVGWVTGVGNVAPVACVELQEHVLAGRLAEARELYPRLQPLARLDMTPHLVQYFKGAMDAVGLHGGPTRPPRLPLDDAHTAILDAAIAALGVPAPA
jgi:4-hydroxy-tetrahydrodipicolinate synthase